MSATVEAAKAQIEAAGTAGLVYIIIVWDDITLGYYRDYRRQLAEFAKSRGIDAVHIKVGLRFNRRMRLTLHRRRRPATSKSRNG